MWKPDLMLVWVLLRQASHFSRPLTSFGIKLSSRATIECGFRDRRSLKGAVLLGLRGLRKNCWGFGIFIVRLKSFRASVRLRFSFLANLAGTVGSVCIPPS